MSAVAVAERTSHAPLWHALLVDAGASPHMVRTACRKA